MQILVDASVWIDYFTGEDTPQTDRLDRLLGRAALAVADLTLLEVLAGLPDEHHRKLAAGALRKLWMVDIHGFDLAEQCAVHFHSECCERAPAAAGWSPECCEASLQVALQRMGGRG